RGPAAARRPTPRRGRESRRGRCARRRRPQAPTRPRQDDQGLGRRLPAGPRQGEGEARARPGIHPLMRMSRERIFFLAERIMKELGNVPGVTVKSPDDVRPEIIRVLTDESKLEESVDTEVRKTLASYA